MDLTYEATQFIMNAETVKTTAPERDVNSLSIGFDTLESGLTEDETIGKLVEKTQTFSLNQNGNIVNDFFTEHPEVEGVVVMDGEKPVGLVMRNEFYQKVGTRYGRELFMNRPIKLIMNIRPLIVDISVDIATIGLIAMNREQNALYDFIIITDNDYYIGVVSIKRFMIELSKNRGKEIEQLREQKDILYQSKIEVESKNSELNEKNHSFENLLDNTGQSFFSFGADLIISEEYSSGCVQLFGEQIGGKKFTDLIEKYVPYDVKRTMLSLLGNVFSSLQTLQQKVYLSLMPNEIYIQDKTIRIDYKVVEHSLHKRVMLILMNVTDRKNLEIQVAEERKNLTMIMKAIAKKSDFKLAIEEFRHFVHERSPVIMTSATEPATELYRLIRVHKSDFAELGLHNTVKTLDEMEDFLASMRLHQNEKNKAVLQSMITTWNADSILQNDMLILTNALGKDFFDKYQRLYISKEKLSEAERKIEAILTGEERSGTLQQLRSLRCGSLKDLLSQYECYVRAVAKYLTKHVEPIITGDDLMVDIHLYSLFIKSLEHIFRNMVDYGIESTEERVSAGKKKIGKIHCHITNMGGSFVLGIFNDGYSPNNEKIYRKAIEKAIISPEDTAVISHEKIYEMLLMAPPLIKNNVTMISGSKVGFSSVKTELERLGGKIRIRSGMGKGTGFEFLIPLAQHH